MKKRNKCLWCVVLMCIYLCVGCGNSSVDNTEGSQTTEETQETESEFYIEIVDAKEILTKTWDSYTNEERFEIMGGHFASALIGMPEKFDLTQVTDLSQMYCVPEAQIENLDDGATMIDLYNAGRFMAGAFHVIAGADAEMFATEMRTQILENQWHGEKPEKLLILKIDEQYVIPVWGREVLVDEFKEKIEAIYQEMIVVVVEEKII